MTDKLSDALEGHAILEFQDAIQHVHNAFERLWSEHQKAKQTIAELTELNNQQHTGLMDSIETINRRSQEMGDLKQLLKNIFSKVEDLRDLRDSVEGGSVFHYVIRSGSIINEILDCKVLV